MNRAVFAVLPTIIAILTLGGCTMTSSYPVSEKTGQQLRTEVIAVMNDAIAASGIPDGRGLHWEPGSKQWNPDTVEFLGEGCTTGPGNDGRLFESGQFHAPVGDPIVFARRMADHWEIQGYTVSIVGQSDGVNPTLDLRADRPDGTLYAGVVGSNTLSTSRSIPSVQATPA